ncbi:MAG: hypothetical protein LBQ06_06300 [Frankiaceae bacterium]|nr:hypothetical protein [Frankiaceae bacterium]
MSDEGIGAPAGSGGDEPAEPSERFLAAMDLAETPEQQGIAREIYRRLAAGEDVEDVQDLIERMTAVVVEQRRRPRAGERRGHAG